MLQINLLPVRKIKQQFLAKRQLKFFGIAVLALTVILILYTVTLHSTVSSLNTEKVKLEADKKRLAQILKQIEELEEKKKLVDKQTEIVERLEKTSALTAYVLNEVANITPHKRMWLTTLDQSGSTMKLDGMALDNQTVAEYLKNLDASGYISNVTLTKIDLKSYAGRNLKAFSLTCTVSMEKDAAEKTDNNEAIKK